MHIPRPAPAPTMKDAVASSAWLPKRARRALTSVFARLRVPRGLRRCALHARWPLVALALLVLVSVALLHDAFRPSLGASVLDSARSTRVAPLDAAQFSAIVRHIAVNATAVPHKRLSDPALIRAGASRWARERDSALPLSAWDELAPHVAFAIKTGHEVSPARLRVLRESGWLSLGRHVPNVLVVSDADDVRSGVVGVKRYAIDVVAGSLGNATARVARVPRRWFDREGWRGDKDKNLPILHMLAATFPDKKWYILLDDDTHIFLDNFAQYARATALARVPIYTGKVFYISNCGGFSKTGAPRGNPKGQKGLFAHGGAGIFINAQAMKAIFPSIATCISEFSSCWAGDMQVGLCMHRAGIRIHNFMHGHSHEYMFTPFWPSRAMADRRYTKRLRSSLQPVTFHKIPLPELKLITAFERECALKGEPVAYGALREYLQDHGIEPVFGQRKTVWDTKVFFRKR